MNKEKLNDDEYHILKVLGKPEKIKKNMLDGYLAIWKYTNSQVLNLFKKNKDYATIKLYPPYWKIGFIPENRALFQLTNRRGYKFKYNVSLNFVKLNQEVLKNE